MVQLEFNDIKRICQDCAELGAAAFAKQAFPEKDILSQREAYTIYGEGRVKMWLRLGFIHPVRRGTARNSKIGYSRAELVAAVALENINKTINK